MTDQTLSLLLAFGATVAFATASIVYAEYSHKISVVWMNCFKAVVSFIALAVTIPFFSGWHAMDLRVFLGLLVSGFIGVNIADLFLLSSFTTLGVGRTLILFGFQPLFMGVGAYFLFGQKFGIEQTIAILFLIACLFTFSFERYRKEKRWEVKGLVYALLGVALECAGTIISRACFTANPDVTPMEGHFYRCLGAVIGFIAIGYIKPFRLVQAFREQTPKVRTALVVASMGGTYLSLLMYLTAVKIGHLASIASIGITGPVFATALECVVHRKKPSRYVVVAFGFFCVGFYLLVLTSQS